MSNENTYRAEILEWLLGRLEKRRSPGEIPSQPPTRLPETPVRSWWIFEGKRYVGVDGSLSSNFASIDRQARRLLSAFSPARRVVYSPEGETDWIASGFHTLTQGRPTYVSRASQAGLSEAETETLLGWLEWIRVEWASYVTTVGTPEGVLDDLPWPARPVPASRRDTPNLRRWAHTAKRSRWPLLRNVAAESLRVVLEAEALDRLPLPSQRETLFEVLCLVRVLREFEPRPAHLRWLDLETGQNEVHLPGIAYSFQHSLPRSSVLSTDEFRPDLRRAIDFYHLRVPARIDGLLRFSKPRGGFHAILLEQKSGSQSPDTAIYQLKCYRAALREMLPQPIIVWAIVENEWRDSGGFAELRAGCLAPDPLATGDVWVFSTADRIPEVLSALGVVDIRSSPAAEATSGKA